MQVDLLAASTAEQGSINVRLDIYIYVDLGKRNPSLTDLDRGIVHGIVAVAEIQRDVLLLLPHVDARRPAQIERRGQIQIDAAQAIGRLTQALGLRIGRSAHGVWKIPGEQRLCRRKNIM